MRREVDPARSFGAGSAALSGSADPAVAGDPILLLIGAVLLAWSPRCLVGVLGFRGVLLTPEAVVVRSGMHRTALRLPWREIDGVVPCERSGEGGKEHKLIALTVLDASQPNSRPGRRSSASRRGGSSARTSRSGR